MITALALAAAGPAPLTEATAACPPELLVGTPVTHPDLTTAARQALTDALCALAAPRRERAPVVLAVGGPCTAVASWYALRCQNTSRRLRPSESIRLEVAERIRGAGPADWRGPSYLLASPGADAGQAVRAGVALRRRHPAVLVGELLLADVDDPDGVQAGALAVVAVLDAGAPSLAATLPPPGPGGSVLLALAARLAAAGRPRRLASPPARPGWRRLTPVGQR